MILRCSLEGFQKVTERSGMLITVQNRIILNTFKRQSAKKFQDNMLRVSNFRMHIFSNSDATIQIFLQLAKPDSIVFYSYITL